MACSFCWSIWSRVVIVRKDATLDRTLIWLGLAMLVFLSVFIMGSLGRRKKMSDLEKNQRFTGLLWKDRISRFWHFLSPYWHILLIHMSRNREHWKAQTCCGPASKSMPITPKTLLSVTMKWGKDMRKVTYPLNCTKLTTFNSPPSPHPSCKSQSDYWSQRCWTNVKPPREESKVCINLSIFFPLY